MWDISRPFFLRYIFLPFMLLTFIPVLLMPVTVFYLDDPEHQEGGFVSVVHNIALIALTIGNIRNALFELYEIYRKTPIAYFTDFSNYVQLGLVVSTTFVTTLTYANDIDRLQVRNEGLESMTPEMQKDQDNLTIAVVITGLFLLIELPNQLRMFDFFTTFVRALYETIFDSAQILASFAIIIFMQAFLIWVTDQGKHLAGWTGLSQALIGSYFMSLGDFAISDTFPFAEPIE